MVLEHSADPARLPACLRVCSSLSSGPELPPTPHSLALPQRSAPVTAKLSVFRLSHHLLLQCGLDFVVLGAKPTASQVPGKCCTTQLHPQPSDTCFRTHSNCSSLFCSFIAIWSEGAAQEAKAGWGFSCCTPACSEAPGSTAPGSPCLVGSREGTPGPRRSRSCPVVIRGPAGPLHSVSLQ